VTMDGQLVLAALAVTGSLLYLGRRAWRTWSGKGGCAGCGCRASARAAPGRHEGLISAEQLTARARRTDGRSGTGG
jgi:hypothetical protein